MQRLHFYGMALLTLFALSCSSPKSQSVEEAPDKRAGLNPQIENGLYLVVNSYPDTPGITQGYPVVPFSHGFLDSNTAGQPMFLEIDTSDYVPFDLSREPEGIPQEDNRLNLLLTLTDRATIKLANFTEEHMNARVAIVIGGMAVTIHKVKAKITDGRLQITRCTDNACEHLLLELKKNKS